MDDYVKFDFDQSIRSEAGNWYRNLQLLGAGRNAAAFLVLATSGPYKGTLFALKLFKRLSLPDRRERFLNEVRFLQQCQHPAIMRLFDEGVYLKQHPFVVAEYLPKTLSDVIRAGSSHVEKIITLIQGASGPVLAKLINQMLVIDSGERMSASDLLVPWQGVFLAAAKRARALEGRVF